MKHKLLNLFLFLASCFMIFVPSVHAQFQNPNYLNTNPNVPQNFHTYTQSVFIEIASALYCQILGTDPINPQSKCIGVDPKTNKIGFVENGGGVITVASNLIGMTFAIPVSSTQYGKYLADNFGFTKKTYAQTPEEQCTGTPPESYQSCLDAVTGQDSFGGTGFVQLSPIIELWKLFRNMVYLLFVFVFVLVGLGIMFRVKIDPRTVMTLQNQIPKIIIALILVTFSYAIVGFLIDMMYVFLYLIFNLFAGYTQSQGINIDNFNPRTIQGSNPLTALGFSFGFDIVKDSSMGVGQAISSLFNGNIGYKIAESIQDKLPPLVSDAFGLVKFAASGLDRAIGPALGAIGGLIAFIVIAATLLVALFKLWFTLLRAYIMILINAVLAPFWIAFGLIPGVTSVGFGPWLRYMLANISVFPVTLLLFLLGKVFVEAFGQGSNAQFAPPFIGNPGNASNFAGLIGLAVILIAPNVVTLVRQAIKAPESKLTAGVGQSFGAGFALPMGLGKAIGGTISSSQEHIVREGGVGNQVRYGPRGIPRALLGRILGR